MSHTVKDGDDNIQMSCPYSKYGPDTQRLGIIINNLEEPRKQKKGRAGEPVRSMSTEWPPEKLPIFAWASVKIIFSFPAFTEILFL